MKTFIVYALTLAVTMYLGISVLNTFDAAVKRMNDQMDRDLREMVQ